MFLFIFWEIWWPHKFILKLTDLNKWTKQIRQSKSHPSVTWRQIFCIKEQFNLNWNACGNLILKNSIHLSIEFCWHSFLENHTERTIYIFRKLTWVSTRCSLDGFLRLFQPLQIVHRAVGRSENSGGARSNVVGIIWPPCWDRVNWSAKNGGKGAYAPSAPRLQ